MVVMAAQGQPPGRPKDNANADAGKKDKDKDKDKAGGDDGYPDYTEIADEKAAKYRKERKIGEGTYAVVYVGKDTATGQRVAIKKIKVGQFKDGMDLSAIREVKFLKELRHPNIVQLFDVFHHKTNLNLVLEFLEYDLEALIRDKSITFSAADIKSWMLMMMRGILELHQNSIVHRDLKPNNLLISSEGILKLADFGLARSTASPDANYTHQAVTRWYRPPELLMGARKYCTSVDLWSAGAIFAELMLRAPFFAGESDLHQLELIFKALGPPTPEEWPTMSSLDNHITPKIDKRNARKPDQRLLFTAASNDALDLLMKFLTYDPLKRISAEETLYHPYFVNKPLPTAPSKLPKKLQKEEESKKRKWETPEETDDPELKRLKRKLY